jgi:hypothetical protein
MAKLNQSPIFRFGKDIGYQFNTDVTAGLNFTPRIIGITTSTPYTYEWQQFNWIESGDYSAQTPIQTNGGTSSASFLDLTIPLPLNTFSVGNKFVIIFKTTFGAEIIVGVTQAFTVAVEATNPSSDPLLPFPNFNVTSPLTFNPGTASLAWSSTLANLNNVNNTSDLAKPISTATQTALDLKQNISTLPSAILGQVLTGLDTALTGAVAAGDTILEGFGRLVNALGFKADKITVGPSLFIQSRYRTNGTDDQVKIQNAIDDVTDSNSTVYGYQVKVLPNVNLTRNAALVETLGSFQRRLAIQLKSGLDIDFKGKLTFSSGGNSNTVGGGSAIFTTAMGNWGDLADVNIKVFEVDGLSTITGADSDEHGLLWLDASSQGGCKVENVHCKVYKGYNTATALFRFRGGLTSLVNYIKGCSYECYNAYSLDALATISRNAGVYHNGYSYAHDTFAEGLIVDGSDKLTILGTLHIDESEETGLRISDNFSALPNKDVVVSGNIIITNAKKHGVLLSGIQRGKFDGLEVRDSFLNSIRITNEGGNICSGLSFSNTKLYNANLGLASSSDDNACHVYFNACDNITFDESCTFGDDQTVKTTSRIANYNSATNIVFDGCYAETDNFVSSSPFSGANNATTNRIINVAGVNPNRMGFVTATTPKPSLNLKNGTSQKVIINQNTTFDNTNPLQSDLIRGQELTLIFEQGSGGATPGLYTVTIAGTSNIKTKASFSVQTGVGVLTTLRLMFISSGVGWVEVGRTSSRQVYTDETQTLTGKTISGASNTLSNIAQSSVTSLTTDLATSRKSQALRTAQTLGSPILAETISPLLATAGTSLTDNAIRYVAIEVSGAMTATGLMFYQRVQGNFVGDQTNGLSLNSQSAGTITKIAETANDQNIWKNAVGWVQVPFTSPVALTAGVYYASLIYNVSGSPTTNPQIHMTSFTSTTPAGNSPLFANSNFVTGQITGQNSFPATQATSGVTAVGGIPYLAIY